MKFKFLMSLFLLVILISCSSFISFIESKQTPFKWRPSIEPTTCTNQSSKKNHSLVGSEKEVQGAFQDLLLRLSKQQIHPTFIEKAVLWSLIQMMVRPDKASPTAKLQYLIFFNGKSQYLEFEGPKDQPVSYPYLYALENMLKAYPSHLKLEQLANILDQYFSKKLLVEDDLQNFLTQYSRFLKNDKYLAQSFFREDEVLKKDENLPFLSYTKIVQAYKNQSIPNSYQENRTLYSLKEGPWQLHCNFDITLYKNLIFLIAPQIVETHEFGLHDNQGNSFIASSTQIVQIPTKSLFNSPLIKGDSHLLGAAQCIATTENDPLYFLFLTSTKERDPGQHIYHLIRGIPHLSSINELDQNFHKARYLFLKSPLRVILESRRTSDNQLKELLKLNLPIYHSSSLGRFWGFFHKNNQFGFVTDDRYPAKVSCFQY